MTAECKAGCAPGQPTAPKPLKHQRLADEIQRLDFVEADLVNLRSKISGEGISNSDDIVLCDNTLLNVLDEGAGELNARRERMLNIILDIRELLF